MKSNFTSLMLILSLLLSSIHLNAQDQSYEILYLNESYDQMIEKSQDLNDSIEVFWHALALNKSGRTLEAIPVLENYLSEGDSVGQIERLLAEYYFETGQLNKAKPLLYRHLDNNKSFYELVRCLELESNYIEAITHLEQRLEQDTTDISVLIRLADNYNEADRILSARDTYHKALKLNPENIIVWGKAANIHLRTKNYWPAVSCCEQALKRDSTNVTIIKIKGIAHFRLGNFDLAEQSFNYLLSAGDSSLTTLKHLGISESKSYRFVASRKHLLMAYEQDSADHEICYFLGRAFLNSSTPDSGLYYLNLADTLIQPSPAILAAILVEKSAVYSTLEDYETAIEMYVQANEINPKPEYYFFIASIYKNRLNRKDLALDYYMEFIRQLPPQEDKQARSIGKQKALSMRRIAEDTIEALKEELFFEGDTVSSGKSL